MNTKKILQTLELAETELKSCYRKLGIIESNVLKDIVEAQGQVKNCSIPDVSRRLYLDGISIELYSNDSDEDYRIDISISNLNGEAMLNKEQAIKLYKYLGASLNVC